MVEDVFIDNETPGNFWESRDSVLKRCSLRLQY